MSQATSISLPLPARVQRAALRGLGKLPSAVFAPFARRTAVNADGDHLDPVLAAIAFAADNVPGMDLGGDPVDRSRRKTDENGAMLAEPTPPLSIVEDFVIDGPGGPLPMTRYRAGLHSTGLILFFHGGGWTQGSRISHDGLVRKLAIGTGADVVSVDYRLAPEHPFPAAPDDALAAWRYVVDAAPGWGVDPARIVVAGDSAGANLSTVLCLDVRGEDVVPCLQLLMYPVTDLSRKTESRREFATGFYLTDARMTWFSDQYVPEPAQRTDPRCSPLLAEDLSGLPPAHVTVAGFDPLRDEGITYAQRLREAGVTVTLDRAGSLIHAFANMTLISAESRAAVDRMIHAVRHALR